MRPMNPGDKREVQTRLVEAVALVTVAAEDRERALALVGRLSTAEAGEILAALVDVAGLILRWSDKAERQGGGISVRELLTRLTEGLGDDVDLPSITLN